MGRVCARARELCQQVGETPQLVPVLLGLFGFYFVRAELQTARELAERSLRLAQEVRDPALLLYSHRVMGQTLLYLGELTQAREHLEQGITRYDPRQHHSLVFLRGGADSDVACRIYAAHALWSLGYPDQALQRCHEALTLTEELSHPFTLAYALYFVASLHLPLESHRTLFFSRSPLSAWTTTQTTIFIFQNSVPENPLILR